MARIIASRTKRTRLRLAGSDWLKKNIGRNHIIRLGAGQAEGEDKVGELAADIIVQMHWIYLSPHLDDAVFSCGGLIWEQTQAGEDVEVWTICAGEAPAGRLPVFAQSLHDRWGTGEKTVWLRRKEDEKAVKMLGAKKRWFEIADSIYRRDGKTGAPLYESGAAVFGAMREEEADLFKELAAQFAEAVPAESVLVAPLAIGNHVDHQMVRLAAEHLGRPLRYYADFPYIVKNEHLLGFRLPPGSKGEAHAVSKKGLAEWQRAVACYASQLRTFWEDDAQMKGAIENYWRGEEGVQLWGQAE